MNAIANGVDGDLFTYVYTFIVHTIRFFNTFYQSYCLFAVFPVIFMHFLWSLILAHQFLPVLPYSWLGSTQLWGLRDHLPVPPLCSKFSLCLPNKHTQGGTGHSTVTFWLITVTKSVKIFATAIQHLVTHKTGHANQAVLFPGSSTLCCFSTLHRTFLHYLSNLSHILFLFKIT